MAVRKLGKFTGPYLSSLSMLFPGLVKSPGSPLANKNVLDILHSSFQIILPSSQIFMGCIMRVPLLSGFRLGLATGRRWKN